MVYITVDAFVTIRLQFSVNSVAFTTEDAVDFFHIPYSDHAILISNVDTVWRINLQKNIAPPV